MSRLEQDVIQGDLANTASSSPPRHHITTSRIMPKRTYPHIYPPRKRLHLHKTHLLDLPDDVLIYIVSLLQPPQHTLSGRSLTHAPGAFALSRTCTRFHAAFLEVFIPHIHRIDATTTNRFTALYHHPRANQPLHIAAVIRKYARDIRQLRVPRYYTIDPTPVIAAAASSCTKIESVAFADDACVTNHVAGALFGNNPGLQRVAIYAPGVGVLTALSEFMGILSKLSLHSMKACILPHVKTLLQTHGGSIRFLVLGFDNTDFMKTISTPWKYDPLRPFHEILNYLKDHVAQLLPVLEKISINLGGRSHFADGLELQWFRELSDHCEVEVHSAAGAMSIPAKSGIAGVHFVKSLNLGTIFTGPGTYRIGCPSRIDLSNHGFIDKYANGAQAIKNRVKSLVKTVVRHSTKPPALLSVHVALNNLRIMKMVSRTITDMLTLVPGVTELEISREIVDFAFNHVHEARYRKMFKELRNIKLIHLVNANGLCERDEDAPERPKILEQHKRGRFLRALPEFLRMVSKACERLECILLDDFTGYDGGLRDDIEGALNAVDWLERQRRDLDIGSIRGLLENWKRIDERVTAGEIVW